MRIEMIFFDVGETLVDVPSFLELFQLCLQEHEVEVETPELLRSMRDVLVVVRRGLATRICEASEEADRRYWQEMLSKILTGAGADEDKIPAMVASFLKLNLDPTMASPFDDSFRSLEILSEQGYRLGVISNWDWHLPDLLTAWGFSRFFDPIIASARVGASKPNPRIFEVALERAGVAPQTAIQIGDRVDADVLGARAVGMVGVYLDRLGPSGIRWEPFDDGEGAYPVIDTLDLLPRLIEELTEERELDA